MKKALLILTSFLWISTCGFSQTNLMTGWDGNGKTGTGSEPNNFGWDCTVIDASTGWTQSGSGANRYMDNAYDYCPGRMLFLRWDAVGGTTIKSIYSYPVELEACRIYIFKGKYAYHNNGKGDFEIGINSKKDNTGTSLFSGLYTPDTWAFKEAVFSFVPSVSGTYYLTIANPDGATMLGAVSELSMTGIDYPYIGVSHSSLFFDADANKTVQFAFRATNLTGEDIVLTAPSGVTLDKTRIPVSDAGCGKEVLVTATYNGTATFTNQFVTVANQSVSTLKIPVTSEPSNGCFQPQYPGKNLAPDPTFSNPDAMGGTGNRSINKTQTGRCGTSCGFINGGSYNQIIAWKPNTPYMVRARVFANGTNASLGVFDTGEADVKKTAGE